MTSYIAKLYSTETLLYSIEMQTSLSLTTNLCASRLSMLLQAGLIYLL